jgi:serine/threonine-protein kinase
LTPAAGTVLNNRYTLTERIAAGGMGEVWAATDTVLDRTVAVKLLNAVLSQQSGFLERFRAEARHSASLHHPNITTVFDYGEDDGSAYLVMERVIGQPLSQIISERAPLSAQETASILAQAAAALEAAHQGGVVHRDVKPANILITPDGTAKLTDFGIARLVDAAPLTKTGQMLGTAQYLSPEQAMGGQATASSDIYALGVVGQEMLTGQRPFEADTLVATAMAHINQPPPELPLTVPVGLRSVIVAALAKDPEDRPATAAAMASALGMPDVPFRAAPGEDTGNVGDTMVLPPSALGASALGSSALGAGAQGAGMPGAAMQERTRAMPVSSPAGRTQTMPAEPTPAPPPAGAGSRGRRALLPAAVAVVVLVGLAAAGFALLSDGGNAGRTNAPTVTSRPTSSATSRPSAPAVVASPIVPSPVPTPTPDAITPSVPAPAVTPPAVTTPVVTTPPPRRDNKGKGKGRGSQRHGDKKDGNQ